MFGTTDNPYLAQMFAAQGRQPSEKWIAVRLLEESYQVSNLGTTIEHLDHDDYDLVIVIHPKDLGGKALWALDEWVVTGGKTLVFRAGTPRGMLPSRPGLDTCRTTTVSF